MNIVTTGIWRHWRALACASTLCGGLNELITWACRWYELIQNGRAVCYEQWAGSDFRIRMNSPLTCPCETFICLSLHIVSIQRTWQHSVFIDPLFFFYKCVKEAPERSSIWFDWWGVTQKSIHQTDKISTFLKALLCSRVCLFSENFVKCNYHK